MMNSYLLRFALLLSFSWVAACSKDDAVSSTKDAERAYLGLDRLIEVAIDLGFKGMNSTNGATIQPQSDVGTNKGKVTVTGKVDQGNSNNKNMNLNIDLDAFSDDGKVTYETPVALDAMGPLPVLDMSMKGLPNGTLTGALKGDFGMSGDLGGTVTLNLLIAGTMQPCAMDMTKVCRKDGATTIKGTATSKYGTYDVDLTK